MTRAVGAWLPALALTLNAFTWGVSWWPFRQLQAAGLHPLWATALIYAVAVVVITLRQPGAWGELLRAPTLWVLVLASGTTNATFNWAMSIGDVVRVVLLFYLMPLWAVLLARVLLGERFTTMAWVRVALALVGAAIVLWPDGGSGWPLPHTLPDWLAVAGGFSFALNNVMLRREAARSPGARALAMFTGGTVVSAALALSTGVAVPDTLLAPWLAGALALSLVFLAGNLALQYGAARLPANATAVIMITEVLFASGSAVLLGAGVLTPTLLLGGGLIVLASLLAARG
ncbi:MAG: hypothetical protein RJA10_1343 [Pseudomonadota bacterium]|jgi:drug/metabolite transporter (DMT)-like permease